MWAEINGIDSQDGDLAVNEVPSILVTDAKALFDAAQSETSALGLKERRSGIELLCLKENLARNMTKLRWVNSGAMLPDGMTKSRMRYMLGDFLRHPQWKIVDDEKFHSHTRKE